MVSGIYELPFFKDSSNLFLREVLGGWQVSGVATFQSGAPLNVMIQGDRANTGGSPNQRPNVVGNPELSCQTNPSGPGLVNCFDATAFSLPDLYTFGNATRNMIRGLGYSQTDLALSKGFVLGGRFRALFQAQVFNLFNEVNWGAPNTTLGAANFGRVTSALGMRSGELGLKLTF